MTDNSTQPTLNIFTCADKAYEGFVPLFAASCLWSNPEAVVEIGVENAAQSKRRFRTLIEGTNQLFSRPVLHLRDAVWKINNRKILPNSVRFLSEPEVKTDFVYISDIDIVTLESGILKRHLDYCAANDTPYSNLVRPGTKRLTGLHFTRWDALYPLPPHQDLVNVRMNDEVLLYELVRRKIGAVDHAKPPFRPIHGIHISPNREPYGHIKDGRRRPGWGVHKFVRQWRHFRRSDLYRLARPMMSPEIRKYVQTIDEVAAESFAERKAKIAAVTVPKESDGKEKKLQKEAFSVRGMFGAIGKKKETNKS